MFHLLLVDDDPEILELLALALRGDGIAIVMARDLAQAMRHIERGTVNAAVLDVHLSAEQKAEGLTLLGALLRRQPAAKGIVITGCGESSLIARAYRLGAAYFMRKPLDVRELRFQLQLLGMPPEPKEASFPRSLSVVRAAWRLRAVP